MITGPSGLPHAIVADGKRREVTAIREDWLVQDRWWTDEPVDRHYFELIVEPGTVLITFRDTRTGDWFAHAHLQRGRSERPTRRSAESSG